MRGCSLYRFYDAQNRLLYVGISLSTVRRIGHHRSNANWFALVASARFEHFPNRKTALRAEAKAIRKELPVYNRTHLPNLHRSRMVIPESLFIESIGTVKAMFCRNHRLPYATFQHQFSKWMASRNKPLLNAA